MVMLRVDTELKKICQAGHIDIQVNGGDKVQDEQRTDVWMSWPHRLRIFKSMSDSATLGQSTEFIYFFVRK